jgi:uncharacterized protein YbjT (DUF2867 family)
MGARAAIGSVKDLSFLTSTFTGADAVYCMLPPFDYMDKNLDVMVEARTIATNYAEAILQSGVKRLVHLSSIGAHTDKGNGLLAFHHIAESVFKELPSDISIVTMRPVGFYYNVLNYIDMIRGKGLLGFILTLQYAGLGDLLKGRRGVIASNFGGEDKLPWVSPLDIAAAIAEEISVPFAGRKIRYVASEEITCNEIARILGEAIGKPYLKWALMTDKQMLSGLKMFGVSEERAQGIVEMQAGSHTGSLEEDYYKNRPSTLGKVKWNDYAKEFAALYFARK